MTDKRLHDDAIVIDGLIISNWGPSVFEDMRRGGLTAANCTCSVWEVFAATMANVATWKRWLRAHADVLMQVHGAADIRHAKADGKVGIILGAQNTSGIEDRLDSVQLLRDLGLGIMQLTYNTQNLVGCGCYEDFDPGLSGFGREVVEAMNAAGIAIDLSHVGPATSRDAIAHSKQPVTYSHICPSALKAHPRNKTDDEIRAVVDKGGFIGVTMFPPFLPRGGESTLEDYVDVIEHVVNVAGEDNTGIGTDFTQDQGEDFFAWLHHDKGYARHVVGNKTPFLDNPSGLERIGDFPNLTAEMERRKWPEPRIRKVLGENWLRYFAEVWGR